MFPLIIGATLVAVLFALSAQRDASPGAGAPPNPGTPPNPGSPPDPGTPPNPGSPPDPGTPPTVTDCTTILAALPEATKAVISAANTFGDKAAIEAVIAQLTASGKVAEAMCLRSIVGPPPAGPPSSPPITGVPKEVMPVECAQMLAALPEPYKSQLAIALASPDAATRLESIALALAFFPAQAACVRLLIPKAKVSPGKLRAGCQDIVPGVWRYAVKKGDSPALIATKFFGPSGSTIVRWGELIDNNLWSVGDRPYIPGDDQNCISKTGSTISVSRYLGRVGVPGTVSYNFASLQDCDILNIPRSWNPWIDELGVATGKLEPWPICP